MNALETYLATKLTLHGIDHASLLGVAKPELTSNDPFSLSSIILNIAIQASMLPDSMGLEQNGTNALLVFGMYIAGGLLRWAEVKEEALMRRISEMEAETIR